MRRTLCWGFFAGAIVSAVAAGAEPSLPSADGIEYFEKQIRPLLAENCYQCHGPKKQEGGLALSSASGLRKGGDRGPPIMPGQPEASLLIQAVGYADDDLKMPPRGKLKDDEIAALVTWVKLGAPLPAEASDAPSVVLPSSDFNLAERRKHWAYQPVHFLSPLAGTKPGQGEPRRKLSSIAPGANLLPANGVAWCSSPIDAFLLARLHAAGLSPASPAEKRTLIRRVTFDLAGLPPTPDEVQAFLSDEAPDAYERLVDRLLASPRFGERFGRHWLDVVRYSESLGFEFDYDLHNAWRYRDYVIRALNSDLPYDQFVVEHLAGDLLRQPRLNPLDGCNDSILATGFWWMHEGKQTPVDIRQYQADCIDNQLDVLGKAFLGQTIACARCHDHKFDAISTRDYYALAGYLRSSRYQQAFVDPPDLFKPKIAELARLRAAIAGEVKRDAIKVWKQQAEQAGTYLVAAASVEPPRPVAERRRNSEPRAGNAEQDTDDRFKQVARERGLDAARLKQWSKALADEALATADHPLYAFAQRVKASAKASDNAAAESSATAPEAISRTFESFDGSSLNGWFATGEAFASGNVKAGEVVIGTANRPVARITSGGTDSGVLSGQLQGELRSQSFTIDKNFVHIRLAGRNTRLNLVIDGYTLIMNPIYGKLTAAPASDQLVWRTIPVDRWVGHRAFIEASDSTIPMHGLNPPPSPARMPVGPDGYIALDEIVFSDDPNPPLVASRLNDTVAERAGRDDLPSLASVYQCLMVESIDRWEADHATPDDIALLNWLLGNGLFDRDEAEGTDVLAGQLDQYCRLEAALPAPQRAAAVADGSGEDEFIFLRGNYRAPGERAPRNLPEVLVVSRNATEVVPHSALDDSAPRDSAGSGRLDLARRLVDPNNPLIPRVIVNRLWQHHFGEGIVRTPDDFGRMGQPPTHPELLDYLAAELVKGGWSLKAATRRMVSSSAYRQSSQVEFKVQSSKFKAGGDESTLNLEPGTLNPTSVDPDNRLLHRMPIRRLEAEAIRDSVLAVSGRLSGQMHGPSVLPHITPYMEGRGKPQSGPLDGEGRRSLYINARRNFLTPLLLAFDYPVTFTPIGRRGAATIPSQALALMNDPLVVSEAKRWAERALAEGGSTAEQRIESLYQTAFSRPPSADEVAAAIDFLQEQSLRHGGGSDDPRVWADLCHVLINVKEFIFID